MIKNQLHWHNVSAGRYYFVHVQPDLFQHWCVTCVWGGIGTKRGGKKNYAFNSKEDANNFINGIKKKRITKGYCLLSKS